MRLNTDSLVRYPASRMPGISGEAARAPVQMAAFEKRSEASPTWMVSGPVNLPSPRKTSTPSDVNRRAESLGLRLARSRRILAMTSAKS